MPILKLCRNNEQQVWRYKAQLRPCRKVPCRTRQKSATIVFIIADNIGLDWRRLGNSQYSPYSQKCGEVRDGIDFHFSFPEVMPALVVGSHALINFFANATQWPQRHRICSNAIAFCDDANSWNGCGRCGFAGDGRTSLPSPASGGGKGHVSWC